MLQVRCRLEGTIISRIVIFGYVDSVLCVPECLQILASVIVAMTQNKTVIVCFPHQNLPDVKAVNERRFESSLDGICHYAEQLVWRDAGRAVLMQTVRNQTACALQKLSIFLTKRIQLITLHVHHSENVPMLIPHRDDDL